MPTVQPLTLWLASTMPLLMRVTSPEDTAEPCVLASTAIALKEVCIILLKLSHNTLDAIFETVIFPTISSVSPSVSGALGGQELTIVGAGFGQDCLNNAVIKLPTGSSCDIVFCSDSVIRCVVGAAQNETTFQSTTGLVSKFWWGAPTGGLNSFNNARYPNSPNSTLVTLNGLMGWRNDFSDVYQQQVRLILFSLLLMFCSLKATLFLVSLATTPFTSPQTTIATSS
jgi:hypothetical protein